MCVPRYKLSTKYPLEKFVNYEDELLGKSKKAINIARGIPTFWKIFSTSVYLREL